jgi:O-antigen/teichoic acid export membrane protein
LTPQRLSGETEPVGSATTDPKAPHSSSGVFRALGHIVFSTFVIRTGGFAFSILLRRILGPELTGIWNSFDIALAYLSMISIGIGFSAERLIPGLIGEAGQIQREKIRDLTITWTFLESILVSLCCLAYVSGFGNRHSPDVRVGLWLLPVLFLSHKLVSMLLMLLRSTKQFRDYSVVTIVTHILDWSLVVWAAVGGLKGVFAGATVAALAKLVYLFYLTTRRRDLSFRWRLKLSEVRLHLRYALSYSAFKATFTLSERLDSVVVAYLLGSAALGTYFLGYQITKALLEVPIALSYVAFPHLMQKHGVAGETSEFSAEFIRFVKWDLFLLIPVLLPIGFFGSEVLIAHVLPSFAFGIPAVKLLVAVMGLLAVRHLYYHVLIANGRIGVLTIVTVAEMVAFLGLLPLLAAFVSAPLTAAAAANFMAYVVHLALLVFATRFLVVRATGMTNSGAFDVAIAVFWAALLFGVDAVVPTLSPTFAGDTLRATACIALFYIVSAPLCRLGLGAEMLPIAARIKAVFDRLSSVKGRSRF